MRLIDADAFEKQINKYVEYNDDGKQEINADAVFITLHDQPTIEVTQGGDLISRKAAIDAIDRFNCFGYVEEKYIRLEEAIKALPSAQPERLTDDDFETIRIHLNAYKEKLCNQKRWEEAEDYQRIIDRFVAFASAQKKGEWIGIDDYPHEDWECSVCGSVFCGNDMFREEAHFCPNCGESMGEEKCDGKDTTN